MINLNDVEEEIKNDTTRIGEKAPKIRTLSDVVNSSNFTANDFNEDFNKLVPEFESDLNVRLRAGFDRGIQDLKNIPEQLEIYGGQALMSIGGFIDSGETVSMGRELIKSAFGELQADEKKYWESAIELSDKDKESFGYGLGQGIANYGSMLAIGYVSPVAGIGLGTALEVGQKAEEKIGYHIEETGDSELNKYTSQKAQKDTLYTTIYGVGSAIIEKKFGLGEQLKMVKMPITSKLKHVVKTMVSEGGTETLQELFATGLDWKGGYIDSSKLPERFMGALKEGAIGAVLGGGMGVASAINHRSQAKAILREQLKNAVPEKDLDNVVDGIYESANDSMSTVVAQELIQSESLRNKHGALYNQILQEINKQIEDVGAFSQYTEAQRSQYAVAKAKEFADWVLGEANKRGVVIDEVVKASEIVYKDGKLYPQGVTKKTKLKRLKEKIKSKSEQPIAEEVKLEVVSPVEDEIALNEAISEYADIMEYDLGKMSFEEKKEVYDQMQRNLFASEEPIVEGEDKITSANDGVVKSAKIEKTISSNKKVDKEKAQNEGRNVIEFNVESLNDKESIDYMRSIATKKYRMSDTEFDDLLSYMRNMADTITKMAKENNHKMFSKWNERSIARYLNEKGNLLPIISAFKTNGDYPMNFDLSSLCTRREATNTVIKHLIDMGYAQQLGTTQIEALKDILRDADFTTACDICFVESKRLRQLAYANTFAYEWESVRMALGITDENEVGTPREFTEEQKAIISEMTSRKKAVRQQAYDKYIPESRKRVFVDGKQIDSGITPDKMKMIATLFKQDSSFAGVFNAEWLMSSYGVDWLMRTYPKTNIRSVLASMYGTATPKPIEGFNIYDPLSWKTIYDVNNKSDKLSKVFAIGGFRGQSFSDFNSLQAFDYFQFFCDLAIRNLPIHMYTKVPSLVELFGETGAMFNMSLVPEMVEGVDKEHAGLKPDGKGGWEYAWSKDSFPIEDAMRLRKEEKFGGRVGTIAVGVSDAHILKMLDDPEIDMVIPYHASGMPLHTRTKTGLNKARDYTDVQSTKGVGKKDYNYNERLQKIGDPKKTAQDYLDWCKENGFTPKFEEFSHHENYYKLLEDFRGYDNNGKPVLQQAVDMSKIEPESFAKTLDKVLTEREKEVKRQDDIVKEKDVIRKINRLMSKQKIDAEYRTALVSRLKTSLGKDNVKSLRQNEFKTQLVHDLIQTKGVKEAKRQVEVFRKNDGVVYGYTKDNVMYLNENVFNANTPAHEFTHIWSNVAKNINPELWQDGKALLKQSEVWQEVMEDSLYLNIREDEDAVASEVLSRIVGRENEELIRKSIDPKYKPLKEQSAITQRIMEWFKKLWGEVRSLFDYNREGKPLTYEEFIHMPLKDLWEETRNVKFNKSLTGLTAESTPQLMSEYEQVTGLPKKERELRGSFDVLTKSIKITSEADFSTYSHEFAHFFLDNIWNYVNSGMASEKYIKEFEGIKKWLGVKGNYPTRSQHEKFARAYEKYLYKGTNADAPIGQAFKGYENFIREVYSSIAEIDTRAGLKYRAVPKLVYDFFNNMTSGTLPFYGDVEEPEKEVKKEVKEVKEFVAEETKVLEENRANYNLKPVETDIKKSYLTAYFKMTGEEVEAGTTTHEYQEKRAMSFIESDLARADRIAEGKELLPDDILDTAFNIMYARVQKRLGNRDKYAKALLNASMELRRYGQEIEATKLAYQDEKESAYWINKVMTSKAEALADSNSLKLKDMNAKIEKTIKAGMKDGKSAKDIAKELRNELGVTELFQEEVYPTNETDVASYNYIYKYVNEQLGLSMSMAEAETITRKADDMLASLENSKAKNGNPSVDFFVKQKDLENYANSLAPSSRARVLVSLIGRGNLLASIKSPFTNIENNIVVGILRAITRRIKLQVGKSIVSPELIAENKQYSYEIWKKTGYNVNNITPETPRNTILGEKITHSEGKGTIRWFGKLYEEYVYKWGLGWGDVKSKDFAFTDYVALKATKLAKGDVNKANAIFKDACLIDPQTDEGKEIRQEAIQESLIATYQNKGLLSESLLKYREGLSFGVGFGEFLVPFVKTPANVKSMELKTGFGLLKAIPHEIIKDVKAVYRIKKENPNKSLAELMKTEDFKKAIKPLEKNIELVTQNSLGLLVAWAIASALDDDDYMPSYAFASSKDKQLAKELNIPFNAIRIGDTWISLDYFGPLASPLVGWLQARREESFFAYLKTAGIQVASLPGLGNIADLYQKIEGLAKKSKDEVVSETGDALMEQLYVRSLPAIFSDIAKALDSYERETKGNEIITKIPVLRETAPEKISVTSGQAEELGNPIYDILFGSRVKEQVSNDVADELQRLNNAGWGVSLTTVTRSGLLSELDDDTKQKVREDFAEEYSKQVKRLIKTSRYKRLSDEDKQESINKIRRSIVERLKKRYLKKRKK